MNFRPARRVLTLAAAAAVGTGAGVAAYALSSNGSPPTTTTVVVPAQPASSSSTASSLTDVYQADAPGVVDIRATSNVGGGQAGGGGGFGIPGQQQQKQQAEGTGFVIDTKGNILTAEHVVDGASAIKVVFEDGSTVDATLVGTDKSTDTAVIHVDVDPSKLHPLKLGDSSSAQPGQEVAAIGSPFGLPETLTAGIVSAVNRSITAPNNFSIAGAIQTDAAINHGNSGGPLIDVATNTVIGINDQIESDTNDNAGVGFAVPINDAKASAQTLIAGGTVQHAYMGVEIVSAPNAGGARIGRVVAGSPAAKAGLKNGDLIKSFGGKSIPNADALTAAVFGARPGQTVTVVVDRNGVTKHLRLTLGTQPKSAS